VRFLVDANLPPALARWISEHGHDGIHISETGGQTRSDGSIWAEAVAAGAVIVSKDEDFARRRIVATTGPQVVWVRLGNTRRVTLMAHF